MKNINRLSSEQIQDELRFQIKALEHNVNLELSQTVYFRLLTWIQRTEQYREDSCRYEEAVNKGY